MTATSPGWSKAAPTPLQGRIKPYLLGALMSAVGAGLLSAAGGNPLAIPALCAGALFFLLMARHLELGIYTLLGASLLLEQFQIFGLKDIVTLKIPFFLNLNLTTGIGALVFNPVAPALSLAGDWPRTLMVATALLLVASFAGFEKRKQND